MRNTVLQSNQIFGQWTTLEYLPKSEQRKIGRWKCKCSCGNICLVKTNDLLHKKSSKCKTCSNRKNNFYKILPELGGCVNKILSSIKRSGFSRGLPFELTDKEILDLVFKPCFYCNRSSSNNAVTQRGDSLKYNGIDRVDNNKGYVIDNVVTCCKYCNSSKMNLTVEEWLKNIANILQNKDKILECSETIQKWSTA